ncbi:MAG: FHA domain-containing protein [Bdellovibrionales bacterium]|nr:FHA domain-containing protein [Bdellovibrionales bacterium]
MFALEITFNDGKGDTETVLVQRPHAIIGASDYSHVVIGDLVDLPYELHLFRGIGRTFRTVPVVTRANLKVDIPQHLEAEHRGEATIDFGSLQMLITALDSDLAVSKGEPLDKSAVRILRRACERKAPYLPAISVSGDPSMTVSFSQDMPLLVGRDRENHLRLDAPDVSGKHAQITYDSGEFFIEDLGSTNGTYVDGQQVSGKTKVGQGKPIVFGRSVVAYTLAEESDLSRRRDTADVELSAIPEERYPMLVSLSEVVRPQRLVIQKGQTLRVGREPSSDMWLGAPHVSRRHCTIDFESDEMLVLTDLSMNGLAYDGGVLTQGESVELDCSPCVLNFGGGITVAVCFDEKHEKEFVDAHGDPRTFFEGDHFEEEAESTHVSSHSGAANGSSIHRQYIEPRRRDGVWKKFLRLRLFGRILVLLTIFLGVLAIAMTFKMILPMF